MDVEQGREELMPLNDDVIKVKREDPRGHVLGLRRVHFLLHLVCRDDDPVFLPVGETTDDVIAQVVKLVAVA